LIPGYLEWQRAREAQGWRWQAGEIPKRVEINTPGGRNLSIKGRLDRVDLHRDDAQR
jgi:ATP-dependent helicase/nuclease subunit B